MHKQAYFLIGFLGLLLGMPLFGTAQERPRLSVETLYNSRTFAGDSFRGGRWASEGPIVRYIQGDRENRATHLMAYNLETDARTRIIEGTNLFAGDVGRYIRIEDYAYSEDGTKVLFYTDSERVWRLNTKGYYYVYDLANETLTPVSEREKGLQMFAKFSPNGREVAFVRDRNLFVVNLQTGLERQLTRDGADGTVINGTFDWVYEEEFGLRDGWQWSPNGRFIAFFKLDESGTRDFVMADLRAQYPEEIRFRYPKAGEVNSEVQLGVIEMATGQIRYFDTDTWNSGGERHEYLARMGWTPPINGTPYVWMFRLNRDQNDLDLLYGNPNAMTVETVMEEKEATWIEVSSNKISYLDDDRHFVWISEVDGFKHLYLYRNDGTQVRQITQGDWEVTTFHGLDEAAGYAYFTATKESSLERHLYRIAFNSSNATPEQITNGAGTHGINLSSDFQYYIDNYSNHNTPNTTTLHSADGRQVNVLENNARLKETLQEYALPAIEFMTVPGADGTPLNAYMIKPTSFSASRQYPVFMHVYGGPGSQEVRNAWGGTERLWHMMLAEEHGIIVVGVDNRGTGARGKAFKSQTYKKLGVLEAEDQIAAAQYLGALPYVDEDRIGIWGWSYGGFMTLMAMLYGDGPDTFKMGISVAPVTDWRQYDTIYTERYMSTPQRNKEGYDMGAPITYADRLKDHQRVLIVHGDLDDNVHFQNAVQMVSAFQRELKQFDLMVYPGRNHGIFGGTTRFHLFTMFTRYIVTNL